MWKDPKNPGNGCLYCTSDNAGGLQRKVTDGEAIRKFAELKDQMPQFRAHLELQPPVPLYLARLSLANHELGDPWALLIHLLSDSISCLTASCSREVCFVGCASWMVLESCSFPSVESSALLIGLMVYGRRTAFSLVHALNP